MFVIIIVLFLDEIEKYGVDDFFEIVDLVFGMVFFCVFDDGLVLILRGLGILVRM